MAGAFDSFLAGVSSVVNVAGQVANVAGQVGSAFQSFQGAPSPVYYTPLNPSPPVASTGGTLALPFVPDMGATNAPNVADAMQGPPWALIVGGVLLVVIVASN